MRAIIFIFFAKNFLFFGGEIITNEFRSDGFGSQYQQILFYYIFAEMKNLTFHYSPLTSMEHNYLNEEDYLERKEILMGFKKNLPLFKGDKALNGLREAVYDFIANNLNDFCKTEGLKNTKKFFYESQKKETYLDDNFFNVAFHVRRIVKHDCRGQPNDDQMILSYIKAFRKNKFQKPLKIHIVADGLNFIDDNISNFKNIFQGEDIEFHLENPVETDFCILVFSDVLVMSRSSLSYVAGIISNNTVVYTPFWHPPLPQKNWIVVPSLDPEYAYWWFRSALLQYFKLQTRSKKQAEGMHLKG